MHADDHGISINIEWNLVNTNTVTINEVPLYTHHELA